MLWNTIYEFFVKYVFGGFLYNPDGDYPIGYSALINVTYLNGRVNSADKIISVGDISFTLGNYFSFIATIISLVVILVLCCILIKKIYNICAHVIG